MNPTTKPFTATAETLQESNEAVSELANAWLRGNECSGVIAISHTGWQSDNVNQSTSSIFVLYWPSVDAQHVPTEEKQP